MSLVFYKYISLSAVLRGKKWISIFKALLYCLSNGAYKINYHAKGSFSDFFSPFSKQILKCVINDERI